MSARDGTDTVSGAHGVNLSADPVYIADVYHLVGLADFAYFGVVANQVANLLLESRTDTIHATHRLQHGGLLLEGFLEMQMPMPEGRVEQGGEIQWLIDDTRGGSGSGKCRIPGSPGALVCEILIQIPEPAQKTEDLAFVLGAQLVVERVLFDRFGKQLSDMSGCIMVYPSRLLRLSRKALLIVKEGVAVGIHDHV